MKAALILTAALTALVAALFASFPEECAEVAQTLGRGFMSLLEPAGMYVVYVHVCRCVH